MMVWGSLSAQGSEHFRLFLERKLLDNEIPHSLISLLSSKLGQLTRMQEQPSPQGQSSGPDISAGNPDLVLQVNHIRSNFYRIIKADGAWADFTPNPNEIFVAFWNETYPIPDQLDYIFSESADSSVGEDLEERKAILREVETGVVIDIEAAKNLVELLNEKIQEAEKQAQSDENSI